MEDRITEPVWSVWSVSPRCEVRLPQRGCRLRDAFPRFCKNLFSKVMIIDRARENWFLQMHFVQQSSDMNHSTQK